LGLEKGCELAAGKYHTVGNQDPKSRFKQGETGYWRSSRTPLYGFLSVIPLLFIYEVLVVFVNKAQMVEIRNGADVIFKTLLNYLGLHGPFAYGILLFGVLILLLLLRRREQIQLRLRYFLLMLAESGLYASFLGYALGRLTGSVLSTGEFQSRPIPQLMLSVGAGVYEELVFRAFLFGTTAIALIRLFSLNKIVSYLMAAIFSSIFFSTFHYLGDEPFEMYSFLYRFFAGLIFCGLYCLRGYGITAYTHTFYDLLVLF
jgi:hypothetical protein